MPDWLVGIGETYFNVVGLKNVAYHEWLTNGGDVEEPEEPEEPENPGKPEEPEDPEPGPVQKDTIIIDLKPGHIEGGRSIRTK